MQVRIMSVLRFVVACTFLALVSACGGGGGGAIDLNIPWKLNSDYIGDFSGGGDGGGAGAGGGAGDGSAIVGGLVTVSDSAGHTVTTTTDINGRYHVTVTGFVSPLVATVAKVINHVDDSGKEDGTTTTRVLVSFTTRTPTLGQIIALNLNGLTDKVASDIVTAAGGTGSISITPAIIVAQKDKIVPIITAVSSTISAYLTANGLNPATFDPMTTPWTNDHSGYDAVLDSLSITNGSNVPTRIVPLTPLELTQQLFKALRDTASAYSNTGKTGDADLAKMRLKDAAHLATTPIDMDVVKTLFHFNDAQRMFTDYKNSLSPVNVMTFGQQVFGQIATNRSDGSVVGAGPLSEYQCELAQVTTTVTVSGDTDVIAYRQAPSYIAQNTATLVTSTMPVLAPAEVNAFNCYGVGVPGRMLGTQLDGSAISRWNNIIFLPQLDGTYKYVAQTRHRLFDQTGLWNTATTTNSTREGSATFGTISRATDIHGNPSALHIAGKLPVGFRALKARTTAERALFSYYAVNIDVDTQTSGNLEYGTISGGFTLMKADATVASSASIATGSAFSQLNAIQTTTFVEPGMGTTFTFTTTVTQLSTMNLAVTTYAPNVMASGTLTAADPMRDVTGADTTYEPTTLNFTGSIYEGDGAGGYRLLLSGTGTSADTNRSLINVNQAQSQFNFMKGTFTFNGKLYLKDRPETSIVLNAQNDTFESDSMTAKFIWDTGWGFNMSGTKNHTTQTGSMTFTSTTGVTFTVPVNGGNLPQNIYYKGTLTGTFTQSTQRVDYTDGSFEQF